MVEASEPCRAVAANSCCTTGSTTTTDHMPTLPTEAISTATASRIQARRESGTNGAESRGEVRRMTTADGTSGGNCLRSTHNGAILGMQMWGCDAHPAPA